MEVFILIFKAYPNLNDLPTVCMQIQSDENTVNENNNFEKQYNMSEKILNGPVPAEVN